MIKYSIIVTAYNIEKYIEECLNSIVEQTYKNIEIIVVDDASMDDTVSVCHKIAVKDDRVHVLEIEHGGASCARNAGIQSASGEYLLFVDGDDFIEKDYVAKVHDIISASKTDILLTNHYYLYNNKNGKTIERVAFPLTDDVKQKNIHIMEYIMKNNYVIPGGTSYNVYRREFIIQHQCEFQVGIRWFEDLDFFMQVMLNNPTYEVCDFKYYYYRRNRKDSAIANVTTQKILDKMNIIRKWFVYFERNQNDNVSQMLLTWFEKEYYLIMPFCMPWYNRKIDYLLLSQEILKDEKIWKKKFPKLEKYIRRFGLQTTVVFLKFFEYSKIVLRIKE